MFICAVMQHHVLYETGNTWYERRAHGAIGTGAFFHMRNQTFHLIANSAGQGAKPLVIPQLFENACAELGVTFLMHDIRTLDLATLPTLGTNDLLYRASTGDKATRAEKIMSNPTCASFYTNWTSVFNSRGCSYFLHEKTDIPVIPSVPFIPESVEGIQKAVEQLGDFPVIVKVLGGSHGVGVIRVDSLPSLISLLDYLRSKKTSILLRKYVPHRYYGRLVVVGDAVVASHITYALHEEFRTNAGEDGAHTREARVFSPEIQNMAIRAVHMLGFETGGVDLLFDENDQPYLAEVNFPNDFSTTQRETGIDIAKTMIEHLMKKTSSPAATMTTTVSV